MHSAALNLQLDNFFEYFGHLPVLETRVETKKSHKKLLSAQIGDNSYKECDEDYIIIADSKHNLRILRPAFQLYYDLKIVYLSGGSKKTDNSSTNPFITRIYLWELEKHVCIRIELNNCGVTIGVGNSTFQSYENRKFIGIYCDNTFDIFTLARHLKWELPKDYKDGTKDL